MENSYYEGNLKDNLRRKWVYIIVCYCMVLVTILMCSCSENQDNIRGENNNDSDENGFSITDIQWEVKESISGKKRYAVINCSNNSDFAIDYFEIKFRMKDGLTEEQEEQFFSEIKEQRNLSDNDINLLRSNNDGTWMHFEIEKMIESGQSIYNERGCYFNGIWYVTNYSHYDFVEPDIATISYVHEGLIKKVYYDFKTKKYYEEDKSEKAYTWSEKLGERIPKPDALVVICDDDNSTEFAFEIHGWSVEKFQVYCDECESWGFVLDCDIDDDSYEAKNSEGYFLKLKYDEDDNFVEGKIINTSVE